MGCQPQRIPTRYATYAHTENCTWRWAKKPCNLKATLPASILAQKAPNRGPSLDDFQSIFSNLSVQKQDVHSDFSANFSFGRVTHTRSCSAFFPWVPASDIARAWCAQTSCMRRCQQMDKNAEYTRQCCGDADVWQGDDKTAKQEIFFSSLILPSLLADVALGEKLCKR